MRKLRIEPIEYSKEEREIQYQEYLKSMNRMESYDEFKGKVYANLVAYKEENITRECGHYKGVEYREFLPESYWENELPSMLYPGIIATIRKNLQCDRDDRTSCQLNYWIKKGYSEDEARYLISDRQRTFTLEKCIEKYGEEEGIRVYNERQVKWSRKIEKMYQNGEFSKAPKSPHNSSLYSQIEKEFINDLIIHGINEEDIQTYKTHQLELLNDNFDRCHNRRFMYDITYKNKIIEFNGDFWHMNPSIYDENYFNKISKIYAKDKWEIDKIKIECARKNGYDVLIVWEHDYRKDKENTIQKCLNFLLNKD